MVNTPAQQFQNWLKSQFTAPAVNPEWLQACQAALIQQSPALTTQMPALIRATNEQLLLSHLGYSTVEGTGFPERLLERHKETVFTGPGKGTMVMVVGLTEVGSSASRLKRVLQERKEAQSGVARIRRLADEEEEEEDQRASEGPRIPRGMLKLELSDGFSVCKAIEYRSIPDLSIEDTKLGTKLILKDVEVLHGILLLTSGNTVVKPNSHVDDLDEHREEVFQRNLRIRMGLDPDEEPRENDLLNLPPAVNRVQLQPQAPSLVPAAQGRQQQSRSTVARYQRNNDDPDKDVTQDILIRTFDPAPAPPPLKKPRLQQQQPQQAPITVEDDYIGDFDVDFPMDELEVILNDHPDDCEEGDDEDGWDAMMEMEDEVNQGNESKKLAAPAGTTPLPRPPSPASLEKEQPPLVSLVSPSVIAKPKSIISAIDDIFAAASPKLSPSTIVASSSSTKPSSMKKSVSSPKIPATGRSTSASPVKTPIANTYKLNPPTPVTKSKAAMPKYVEIDTDDSDIEKQKKEKPSKVSMTTGSSRNAAMTNTSQTLMKEKRNVKKKPEDMDIIELSD